MDQGNTQISAYERLMMARNNNRPTVIDYANHLFERFLELKGDRIGKNDESILGGVALFHGQPVTVIGHRKGKNLEENIRFNFGMPNPEGYRKALRLMVQAEKFNRPIITFIDTPGAYPGIAAEKHGQSQAIAECIAKMSCLKTPIISIVTGEANSGGALALAVADKVYMLENAVYSILSPEGFASILWKDATRCSEACDLMKLTAHELKKAKLIDGIIDEPEGGIQANHLIGYEAIDKVIGRELKRLNRMKPENLVMDRQRKYRSIDGSNRPIRKE